MRDLFRRKDDPASEDNGDYQTVKAVPSVTEKIHHKNKGKKSIFVYIFILFLHSHEKGLHNRAPLSILIRVLRKRFSSVLLE